MIVAVKRKKNDIFIKILLLIVFIVLCVYIYNGYKGIPKKHSEQINVEKNKVKLEKKEIKINQNVEENIKQLAQNEILNEVQKIVSLIGQEHVKQIKLVKGKVVFIFEPNTNIDAITVRYGAMALVKKTFDEIVVIVDLDFILKNIL